MRVLNDISAQTDPAMLALALRAPGCALVMMHGYDHHTGACGCAAHANAPDVVFASLFGRAAAAASAGLPEHSIWLDPGFGFGKSPEENVAILRNLAGLCTGPYPVVVGPSRKRFLHVLTAAHRQGGSNGSFDADSATAEACGIARQQGASVLRVHRPESARAEVPNQH